MNIYFDPEIEEYSEHQFINELQYAIYQACFTNRFNQVIVDRHFSSN